MELLKDIESISPSLTLNQIKELAPASFSEEPVDGITERYGFFDSVEIIKIMKRLGWVVISVERVINRKKAWKNKGSHMISFRQKKPTVLASGEIIPTIIATNNHTGRLAFELNVGFFHLQQNDSSRVKGTTVYAGKIRHAAVHEDNIEVYLHEAIDRALGEDWDKYKIPMKGGVLKKFITEALLIRFEEKTVKSIDIDQAISLAPCWECTKELSTLWDYYNNIQSWLIDGGLICHRSVEDGYKYNSPKRMRKITGLLQIREINIGLWKLMVSYYYRFKN